MDTAALVSLVGLALVDSTSFRTLVVPLVLLAQPRVRAGRVGVHLVTMGMFYLLLGLMLLGGATVARNELAGAGDAVSTTPMYVAQALVGAGLVALSHDRGSSGHTAPAGSMGWGRT